jgi:hypothetical protein
MGPGRPEAQHGGWRHGTDHFSEVLRTRESEAEFRQELTPRTASDDEAMVMRQARMTGRSRGAWTVRHMWSRPNRKSPGTDDFGQLGAGRSSGHNALQADGTSDEWQFERSAASARTADH